MTFVENPRNDDDQVLCGAGVSGDLESQARFGFLRQQIPPLEFEAQQNFIAASVTQQDVGKRLCLPNETVERVPAIRIPDVPRQVQRADDLLFDRRTEDSVQSMQIGCHDSGNVRPRTEMDRQGKDGFTDSGVQFVVLPIFGKRFPLRRIRNVAARSAVHADASLSTAAA